MRLERLGGELLEQSPGGIAVGTKPPLLDDHIALLVKLAQHGMQKSLRFQIRPEFEPVDGKRIVVRGLVVIGIGVEIFAAVLLDDLAKFVRLDELIGGGDVIFPIFFKLFQLAFVAAHRLVALGDVGRVGDLDLCQRRFFGGVIGGANFLRALERHVLEHMSQSGFSHGVLRRARVN